MQASMTDEKTVTDCNAFDTRRTSCTPSTEEGSGYSHLGSTLEQLITTATICTNSSTRSQLQALRSSRIAPALFELVRRHQLKHHSSSRSPPNRAKSKSSTKPLQRAPPRRIPSQLSTVANHVSPFATPRTVLRPQFSIKPEAALQPLPQPFPQQHSPPPLATPQQVAQPQEVAEQRYPTAHQAAQRQQQASITQYGQQWTESPRELRRYDIVREVKVPKRRIIEEVYETPHVVHEIQLRECIEEVSEYVTECIRQVEKPTVTEVPALDVEFIDLPVTKQFSVKHTEEKVNVVKIPVDFNVEVPKPEIVSKRTEVPVGRLVPMPLHASKDVVFHVPKLVTVHDRLTYPVYVPVFTEVAIPADMLNKRSAGKCAQLCERVGQMVNEARNTSVSLTQVEFLGTQVKSWSDDMQQKIDESAANWQKKLKKSWKKGILTIEEPSTSADSDKTTDVSSSDDGEWLGGRMGTEALVDAGDADEVLNE